VLVKQTAWPPADAFRTERGAMPSSFPAHPAQPLVEVFWRMADQVPAARSDVDTYGLMAATAVAAIPGCDAASISILETNGPVSHASPGTLAERADQIQFQQVEGPCLDAGMRARWIYIRDLASAGRWPISSQRLADELGFQSMFCCRLATGSAPKTTLGGIGLYSLSLDAYSAADQLLAILLSSLGSLLLSAARQQDNLYAAIATRQMIGEAIGILRAQSNLTSEQAFDMLVSVSMRTNVKLRDVAREIAGRPPVP
jgi:hypothetical protein